MRIFIDRLFRPGEFFIRVREAEYNGTIFCFRFYDFTGNVKRCAPNHTLVCFFPWYDLIEKVLIKVDVSSHS